MEYEICSVSHTYNFVVYEQVEKSEPKIPTDEERDGFDKKKWAAENNLKEIGGNRFYEDWDIGQDKDYMCWHVLLC